MNRPISLLACALGFILTPACGDDDDDDPSGASIRALCEDACATAATLSCPNEDAETCASECEATDGVPEACQLPVTTALECIAERPASDWQCDEDGEATVKDGICVEEGNALLDCLVENTGDGTCPFENDNECDDPTGTDLCAEGTDLADCA